MKFYSKFKKMYHESYRSFIDHVTSTQTTVIPYYYLHFLQFRRISFHESNRISIIFGNIVCHNNIMDKCQTPFVLESRNRKYQTTEHIVPTNFHIFLSIKINRRSLDLLKLENGSTSFGETFCALLSVSSDDFNQAIT